MIYDFVITTPASTLVSAKQSTDLKLTGGIIHQIDLVFPSGPQGYLKVQINHGLHQVWPTNPEGYFASSDEKISFEEFYDLTTAPYTLTAYTWNDDDTYSHLVIVRFGILKRDDLRGVWFPWSGEVYE